MHGLVECCADRCGTDIRNRWEDPEISDLTDEAAHTVVHALVTSRLDYGNCMVFGITSHLLDKSSQE